MYEELSKFQRKNQIKLATLRKDSLIQITIEKMKERKKIINLCLS